MKKNEILSLTDKELENQFVGKKVIYQTAHDEKIFIVKRLVQTPFSNEKDSKTTHLESTSGKLYSLFASNLLDISIAE